MAAQHSKKRQEWAHSTTKNYCSKFRRSNPQQHVQMKVLASSSGACSAPDVTPRSDTNSCRGFLCAPSKKHELNEVSTLRTSSPPSSPRRVLLLPRASPRVRVGTAASTSGVHSAVALPPFPLFRARDAPRGSWGLLNLGKW